jgi:hypothetical protein
MQRRERESYRHHPEPLALADGPRQPEPCCVGHSLARPLAYGVGNQRAECEPERLGDPDAESVIATPPPPPCEPKAYLGT